MVQATRPVGLRAGSCPLVLRGCFPPTRVKFRPRNTKTPAQPGRCRVSCRRTGAPPPSARESTSPALSRPRASPADAVRHREGVTDIIYRRRELELIGTPDSSIRRALRSGTLVRVCAGAYADASAWSELDDMARHRIRVLATAERLTTTPVFSHFA